ncbi:MAG: hypothetical protein R3E52_10120 [Burkholderiaceae bacterium]
MGKVCPPESATGYKQPPPQEKGFAASTAAVSGESKRAINQHLSRADALGDDLERIVGTSERVEIGRALEGELQGRNLATLKQNAVPENFPGRSAPKGDTRDLAAKAAGFGNGKPRAWRAKRKPATLPDCWPCWCWAQN